MFMPENCLAVAGQVYTQGNLAQSIDGLRVQEQAGSISNEDLDESVHNSLAKILRECDSITDLQVVKCPLATQKRKTSHWNCVTKVWASTNGQMHAVFCKS